MSVQPEVPLDEAWRWLSLAEDDLGNARILLGHEASALRTVGFLSQQAAEKALKAVRAAHDLSVPKVHDLAELVAELPALSQSVNRTDLDVLSPWAMAGRYLADVAELSATEASDLVDRAGRVTACARELVDQA